MVKRDRKVASNIDRTSTRHLSSKTVREEAKEAASKRRGLLFFSLGVFPQVPCLGLNTQVRCNL